jgi:hypothetical protein
MDKRSFRTHRSFELYLAMGALLVLVTSVGAAAQSQSGQSATGTSTTVAADPPQAFFSEPYTISKAINRFGKMRGDRGTGGKDGFYPELANLPTGAGWIEAGPGYRQHLAGGKVFIDASAAISWRAYKVAQGRFELQQLAHNHLTVGSQVMWQDLTQVNYFGYGPDSLKADRSQYRDRSVDVVGYATARANNWLSINGGVGWLRRPEILPHTGTFDRGFPDVQATFPNDPALLRGQQPNYLHASASVMADNRDHPGHPMRGGVYRASWVDFSDRNGGSFSFRRYEVEGEQFVPVVANRWTLGAHAFGVFSSVPAGNDVPFYLMPSLGGNNSVRGYSDYRFHDRNLALVSAESRWGLTTHFDAALFFDAGNVARRAGDLDLNKNAYGAGVRVHTQTATLLRVDAAHGADGWRLEFRMNDPFRLSRLTRRTVPVPFVQ